MVNPRWTGFTHTAKAQMQCLDDFPLPWETSHNSKTFGTRLTKSLMTAKTCCAVRKISNCRSKTRARFGYMTYRSGCSNAVNRACAEKLAMCRRFQCPDSTSSSRSRLAAFERHIGSQQPMQREQFPAQHVRPPTVLHEPWCHCGDSDGLRSS